MQLRMRLRARLRLVGTDGTLSNRKNRTHPEEYGPALGQIQLLLRRRQRVLVSWRVAIHCYKLAFSSSEGQMCYLRVGQGYTCGPVTYSQLKDIITGPIPEPRPEPSLRDAMREHVCFNHFVDDDCRGADSSSRRSLPEISFIEGLVDRRVRGYVRGRLIEGYLVQ